MSFSEENLNLASEPGKKQERFDPPSFSGAARDLMPSAYAELNALAARLLRGRKGNRIRTTSLIHEAYLRLSQSGSIACNNRAHFFALAANAMRRVLVDQARRSHALRNGRGWRRIQIEEIVIRSTRADSELLAVDAALKDLASFDAAKARIVEMRFFGGLTTEETAEAIGISTATVKREWSLAKAWLANEFKN